MRGGVKPTKWFERCLPRVFLFVDAMQGSKPNRVPGALLPPLMYYPSTYILTVFSNNVIQSNFEKIMNFNN